MLYAGSVRGRKPWTIRDAFAEDQFRCIESLLVMYNNRNKWVSLLLYHLSVLILLDTHDHHEQTLCVLLETFDPHDFVVKFITS